METVTCGDDCGRTRYEVVYRDKRAGALEAHWTCGTAYYARNRGGEDRNDAGYCPKCGRMVGFDTDGSPLVGPKPGTLKALLGLRYEAVCIFGVAGMGHGYFQAAPACYDDELGVHRTNGPDDGCTGDTPEDAIENLARAGEEGE